MKEELHDRIQRLLDAGDGLALDAELEAALEEAGADARAEAEALAKIDAALRSFPEVELGDDAAEAIATRIEQRLDEDLARIPDPVAAPIFGDKEGQPPRKPAPPKPKPKGADYSLANLTSLSVKDAPAVKPDAPLRRPPQKPVVRESQVDVVEADELGLEELADSSPPPAQLQPHPPPAPKTPILIGDERASIPDVDPFDLKGAETSGELPPPPVDLEAERARRRTIFYWGSGLAAAAALLVVAVTGVSTMSSPASDESAVVAVSPSTASSAEMEEAYMPAAPEPAPADPGQRGSGFRSADEADDSIAAADSVVEAPAEAEAEEESESSAAPAAEPEAASATSEARGTPSRRSRSRMSAVAAEREPSSMARTGGSMATPSREQVLSAMRAIQPQVSSCGGSRHGVVNVSITVSGSTGRVRNAVVQGEFAGTREGSCVARAVRRARLPEFSRDTFSFNYPFRI